MTTMDDGKAAIIQGTDHTDADEGCFSFWSLATAGQNHGPENAQWLSMGGDEMKPTTIILALFVLFAGCDRSVPTELASPKQAAEQSPKELVDRVLDGDALQIRNEDGEKWMIRLVGIDCPEKTQRFGDEATDMLRLPVTDPNEGFFN